MTEYERLSLQLQATLVSGLSLMVVQSKLQSSDENAGYVQQVLNWQSQVARVLEGLKSVLG
ncbi:hypothetical protein VT84_11950 [Gemmata sp. SH-PL17]|uniref:hypothetical protein n=1 Tax=Gemmata sp. SH-PL17 TaxID=1630693 RepID=UPI0004B67506|nr:hypothetical protein [Gemmata sp. SH-PL17]AMV25102.1 hypothetical protein VT84_11950 [Gemmata sp. SH-PL17]